MLISVKAPRMTRPADTTAYAAADLIANSTTAGSVVPLAFLTETARPYVLRGAQILSSNPVITNKNYYMLLFSASPTVTNGDNGAAAVSAATALNTFIGAVGTSGALAVAGAASVNRMHILDSVGTFNGGAVGSMGMLVPGSFYGLLVANAAYTPTSAETFDVACFLDEMV